MMIAAGCFWGVGDVFIKLVYLSGFSLPFNLALLRYWVSIFIYLSALATLRRHHTLLAPRRSLLIPLALGTGSAAFSALFLTSIVHTTVTNAALLIYTAPAFVAVLARIILKERLTPAKLTGIILTLTGASLIMGVTRGASLFTSEHFLGDLLAVSAGMSSASTYIMGRKQTRRLDELTTTLYAFIFASLILTPIALTTEGINPSGFAPAIAYALGTAIATSVAYLLYIASLRRIEATRASVYGIVEPIAAALIANLTIGEAVDLYTLLGGALVLTAVFIVYTRG